MIKIDHKKRAKRIGASEVAALFGLSPYTTPWEIWASKTGKLDPWEGNAATAMGQRFERALLDEAEHKLGPLERDVFLPAPDNLPLGATLDGRLTETGQPVEAKTTGIVGPIRGDWGEPGTDEVPEPYLLQVQTQMICSESDSGYLFALLPGRGVIQYDLQRNDDICQAIITKVRNWWEKHIIDGVEPDRDQVVPLRTIKRIRRQPQKAIDLDLAAIGLVEKRASIKETLAMYRKDLERCESELLLRLGDAEIGELPDGRVVSYAEQVRKAYEVKESTYRVLRIKKGKPNE